MIGCGFFKCKNQWPIRTIGNFGGESNGLRAPEFKNSAQTHHRQIDYIVYIAVKLALAVDLMMFSLFRVKYVSCSSTANFTFLNLYSTVSLCFQGAQVHRFLQELGSIFFRLMRNEVFLILGSIGAPSVLAGALYKGLCGDVCLVPGSHASWVKSGTFLSKIPW